MPKTDDEGAPVGSAEVTSDADGVAVIALIGELDLSNVDGVRTAIEPTVSAAHERIVFDLGRLDFLDSSGIALLLWAAVLTRSVQLRQPTEIVRRIIEVTGLANILHMEG